MDQPDSEDLREEALRRVREADALFADWESSQDTDVPVLTATAYSKASHLRQTAAVLAILSQDV